MAANFLALREVMNKGGIQNDNEFEPVQKIFTIAETKLSPFLNSPFLILPPDVVVAVHLVWLIEN